MKYWSTPWKKERKEGREGEREWGRREEGGHRERLSSRGKGRQQSGSGAHPGRRREGWSGRGELGKGVRRAKWSAGRNVRDEEGEGGAVKERGRSPPPLVDACP